MVFTVINWLWALVSFYLTGFLCRKIFGKLFGYDIYSADGIIMAGVCAVTFYATLFSLFYRVGVLASAGLLIADAFSFLIFRKQIINYIKDVFKRHETKYALTFAALAGMAVATLASSTPTHYDTYLYHAQAIEWIEKYGVVKGLGNLHMRFAYNSSFLCLQALFSWKSLIGQSLHGMNGLLCLLAIVYSLTTLKCFHEKKVYTSDLLKISCVFSVVYIWDYISSPSTDILPMIIFFYIFTKWTELLEKEEKSESPYAYLCLAGIFACTIKLSVAPVVLLVIFPAALLIKKRKWNQLLLYAICGTGSTVPFFVRNYFLSGYLLYPFPEINIFNPDWKIPVENVLNDRALIGLVYTSHSTDRSFFCQFPAWFAEQADMIFRIIFLIDVLALAIALIMVIRWFRERKNGAQIFIIAVGAAGFIYFMTSVYIIRYGGMFMLVFPCLVIGMLDMRFRSGYASIIAFASACIIINSIFDFDTFSSKWLYPADYSSFSCNMVEKAAADGTEYNFFVPSGGDQSGYEVFPETPYGYTLDEIEFRGNTLADGFRYKK